jgi:hypothetical protein
MVSRPFAQLTRVRRVVSQELREAWTKPLGAALSKELASGFSYLPVMVAALGMPPDLAHCPHKLSAVRPAICLEPVRESEAQSLILGILDDGFQKS